jgi:hypothetical protein
MPPTDFCNGASPEHTHESPKPRRSLQRRTAARPSGLPLARRRPAELPQVRGRSGASLLDPHHDDRLPQWIYPDLTDSGTPCHESVPDPTWKTARPGDRAVTASLERTRPASPTEA